jgi:hypothetical protein
MAPVTHIVLIQLKDEASAEAVESVSLAFRLFLFARVSSTLLLRVQEQAPTLGGRLGRLCHVAWCPLVSEIVAASEPYPLLHRALADPPP